MKNRLLSLVTGLLFLFVAYGCGSGSDSDKDPSSSTEEHYSYQLSHNGCDTGKKEFSSKSDYCAALQDSEANGYCALGERRELFELNCGSAFVEKRPLVPSPPPSRDPDPARPPSPPPSRPVPPSPSSPKVVEDLAAAGIAVEVTDRVYPSPGEPPFRERLARFWDRLESVEALFLARNSKLKKILVAEYGSFLPEYQHLTLSVDMSVEDLRVFVDAFDRLLDYQARKGILFRPGVIAYRRGQNGSADLRNKLAFFEGNAARVVGVVRQLELDASSIYSSYFRKLSLNYERYREDFEGFAKILSPAQPCFHLLDSLGLKLDPGTAFTFGLEGGREAKAFGTVTRALAKEKATLTDLRRSGFLEEIDVTLGSDGNYFYPTLKKLRVATEGAGVESLHALLVFLAEQSLFARETKIEFDYGFEPLGEHALTASSHLRSVLAELRPKAALVRKVYFGEKSGFQYGALTAGYADSVAELRRVVKGIR